MICAHLQNTFCMGLAGVAGSLLNGLAALFQVLQAPRISLTSKARGTPEASGLFSSLSTSLVDLISFSSPKYAITYDSQIDQWPGPPILNLFRVYSSDQTLTWTSNSHLKCITSQTLVSLKTCCSCQLPYVGKWHFHPWSLLPKTSESSLTLPSSLLLI